jgi:hypothetical protein
MGENIVSQRMPEKTEIGLKSSRGKEWVKRSGIRSGKEEVAETVRVYYTQNLKPNQWEN